MTKNKLFEEFPSVETSQWEELILKDLKGADYEKKLVWNTIDGLKIKPYYRAEDLEKLVYLQSLPGEYPYNRGNCISSNKWDIRQDIKVTTIDETNKKAVNYISRGANAIGFVFDDDFEISQTDFSNLVKNIDLKQTKIHFVANHGSHIVMPLLYAEAQKQGVKLDELRGSISFDPIGNMSIKGKFKSDLSLVYKKIANIAKSGLQHRKFKTVTINARHFGNSGSSLVQELAFGLSLGNQYLNIATEQGLKIDEVSPHFQFVFSVGSNYFMEIAKIRAARFLWTKIVEQYKPENEKSCKMYIHTVTSDWNKTVYDPYVNMLRTTTEAMSAIIGGTDSLTIEPFDKFFNDGNEFSERIARNQQLVLKEEAYLDKTIDPSAGSYYIENLTDSIIDAAWKLFLETEDKGGYIECFKQEFIQNEIEKTAQKRDMNIATRREIILGVNQYPNFNEKISNQIDFNILNHKIETATENLLAKPLKPYRGAKAFELLRLETEKLAKQPKVFMLTIGNLGMRKARATFACNFFACAGFEVIDNNGFATIEEGISSAIEAQADIVVICSSDDEYAELAPKAFELLNNKSIFVVAGNPACTEDLKKTGIDNFISVKSNVLEELKGYQKILK